MIISDSQESHDRYMERFKLLLCLFIGKLEREPFVVGRCNLEGQAVRSREYIYPHLYDSSNEGVTVVGIGYFSTFHHT